MLKNILLNFTLLFALCCSFLPAVAADDSEYNIISTDALKALTDANKADLVIVDTRNPEEYQEVHIKGAISIPLKKFSDSGHLLPADKNARIIVYCNSGGRSYNAYRKLMKLAYKDIARAIFADWQTAGLPVAN